MKEVEGLARIPEVCVSVLAGRVGVCACVLTASAAVLTATAPFVFLILPDVF